MLSRRDIILISRYLKNKLNQKKSIIFYKKLEEDKDFKAEYHKRLLEAKISLIEKKIFDLIERVSPGENNTFRKRFSLKNYFYSSNPKKELENIGFIDKLSPPHKGGTEIIMGFLDIRRKVIELSELAGNIMAEDAYLNNLDTLLKETGISFNEDKELYPAVNDIKQKMLKKKKRLIAIGSITASIILIVGMILTNPFHGRFTVDKLYETYYSPFQKIQFVTAFSSNELESAKEKYNQGKYYSALTALESVTDSDPLVMEKHFYMGLSYMELKEFEKAISSFQFIIASKTKNEFLNQAEWYLGLCYLKTNEKYEAYKQFRTISGEKIFYSKKAKKLIRRLKRNF